MEKIQKTENHSLLEEAYRLLELETKDEEVFKLGEQQKESIEISRHQIKNGEFLTGEQANKEIDEWLGK
ncbi:hypothetical protein [Pedobacter cryophilus]|uniref:Uncharacterized protein n=1 Tax=Pedobacter cryophilus TaxID=2571271 RepID=A0A4U1C4I9_9SPHI|nr:hypothetical protein [Pedobacter cryophilus]TKC00806.1 hypothetical protein FA046_03780 [Pedobacter cryophilus]